MNVEDIPKCYIKAIKTIRILKYLVSCRKFHQIKHSFDMKVIITENNEMNNRLSIILNDVQRRLDFVLDTIKINFIFIRLNRNNN